MQRIAIKSENDNSKILKNLKSGLRNSKSVQNFQRITLEFLEFESPLSLDLLSPVMINFHMLVSNVPEIIQNMPQVEITKMLKMNPVLCRLEFRPPKNNLPALFEIIVNNELNLKAYFQREDDFTWQKINQRELLGVKMNGFKFMLEIFGSVFIKARVKPKKTIFINCNLVDYSNGEESVVIPKVVNKRNVECIEEIGVGLGNFGEVKIKDFDDYKKVDFKIGNLKEKSNIENGEGDLKEGDHDKENQEGMVEELITKTSNTKNSSDDGKSGFEIKLKREIETCSGESIHEAGVLDCGHKFCYNCIESWANVCNTCPLCKTPFQGIKKLKSGGQYIDYKVIKNISQNLETEDECYICKGRGNLDFLLVCDKCDVNFCHTYCLDPPIDYIPADNWYCESCCRQHNLKNRLKKPKISSEISNSESNSTASKSVKRGRKPGKSENPLKENLKEIEEMRKLRTGRKSRAERRRMTDLAERGSLARRRRFRVRESKKKSKRISRSKSNNHKQESSIRGNRRSKRKKIGKYLENIKKGVLETLGRKVHINEKVKTLKAENR